MAALFLFSFMILLASTPVFQDFIGNSRKSFAIPGSHWQIGSFSRAYLDIMNKPRPLFKIILASTPVFQAWFQDVIGNSRKSLAKLAAFQER